MVKFSKTELDITAYKPKMKPYYIGCPADLRDIPINRGETTAQCKADGEFSYIYVDKNECYAVNRFGRRTEDLPALRELHMQFLKHDYESIELLAELYGVDDRGRPVTLPNFIHYLKGDDSSLQDRIRIGIFDFIKLGATRKYAVNFNTVLKRENIPSSVNRLKYLCQFNGARISVLPYMIIENEVDLADYYVAKIALGWEGLVIRTNGDTYKAKPNKDVDAVIIGINKNTKGYEKGLAKSVKVALMPDEGSFVELGDATVPSPAEAKELFALTRVKVNETETTAFVKPLVVVKISYISLFPDTTNRVYKLLLGGFMETGTMQAARMKSPRVVGYRKDKHANTTDVGLSQIGE